MVDIESKIKNAIIDKEKRWMYKFALRSHKQIESGDYYAFQRSVNLYYNQHTKAMYTLKYAALEAKAKDYVKEQNAKRQREKNYNTKKQKEMYIIHKMYRNDELSKQSIKTINNELK